MRLTGVLVCRNFDEVQLVTEYLPAHIRLTRAEPGCLAFTVTQTRAHQHRGASSEWGRMTVEIERRYAITGENGA